MREAMLLEDNAGMLHILARDGGPWSGWHVYDGYADDGNGAADLLAAMYDDTDDWTAPMSAADVIAYAESVNTDDGCSIVAGIDEDHECELRIADIQHISDQAARYLLGTDGGITLVMMR